MVNATKESELKVYLTNSKQNHGITVMRAVNNAKKNQKKGDQSSDDEDEENPKFKMDGVTWNRQT